MEAIGLVMASLVVLAVLGALAALVGGVLLVAVVGQFLPASPTVSRTSFTCPASTRKVTAEFTSWPGAERPADVLSCSAFTDPRRVECNKACLDAAHTGSVASPMMPRFSLVAGGTAYRL